MSFGLQPEMNTRFHGQPSYRTPPVATGALMAQVLMMIVLTETARVSVQT